MAETGGSRMSGELTVPRNGLGDGEATAGVRSCVICGRDASVTGLAAGPFGEAFCSEGHAEEFVKAVRVARTSAAAALSTGEIAPPGDGMVGAPQPRGWTSYLGKALCWGAPLLAVVLLLGGGSAVLGAAGALLPVLALLVCPLGMYLMMRSMSKMGHGDDRPDSGGRN